MCRSVPQIEVAFTRTSTSVGPMVGTGTFSSCRPFPACVFRNAFMVAGIQVGSLPRQVALAQISMLAQPQTSFSERHPVGACDSFWTKLASMIQFPYAFSAFARTDSRGANDLVASSAAHNFEACGSFECRLQSVSEKRNRTSHRLI